MENDVLEFLEQSNYIEGVFDDNSFDQAVKAWKYIVKQKRLTVENVLKTHAILMKNQDIPKNDKGAFRVVGVIIGNREGLPWPLVPKVMDDWIYWANESRSAARVKEDHIKYEHIHPFIDGNGRTGRIFMNWQRVKAGFSILVIKEEERFEYYKWF